ncbi:shikimate kinase [Candidatus Fokinia crypta]|uniref:Shikimate kinase n=1 Tax=Candidatus Fokinia crypta TaxID=1920990 RepID=A0ABZ0UPW7_9RICK|nr:shikimate kinase [Candidatus Fokinia cryptica]WPX97717.1 Shikimate kinase [Candidatus Fokinia cryptica]
MLQNVKNITKSVVLVGPMGSGKSAIGRRLAKKLKLPFYDVDSVIESRKMLSITEIYDFMGEEYLAQLEAQTLKEILSYGISVISASGNITFTNSLYNIIKEKSISIAILADKDVLYERLMRRNVRPSFSHAKDKYAFVEKMISDMEAIAPKLNHTLINNSTELHQITYFIAKKVVELNHRNNSFFENKTQHISRFMQKTV